MKTIGIVGAGIIGRLLAWQLAQQDYQVSLFDKNASNDYSAASFTAAGMLSPYSEIESADLSIFKMGMNALDLWPKLIKKLELEQGFRQLGSLIVSHANDEPDLIRFNQQLEFKLSKLESDHQIPMPTKVTHEQLAELEPALANVFSSATYLPKEAWLNPHCVMNRLAKKLTNNGVNWHSSTPVNQVSSNVVMTKDKTYQFDWVIDCRGLGAKNDIKNLRAVRGELVTLQAPDVQLNHLIRLTHPRYRLYIVPRGNDHLFTVGATQIESADEGPITVRSMLELLSAAYSLHPGFAEAKLIASNTNCRPALPDNLPKVMIEDGLIRVNGLFRHGFLLAPTLAQEVMRFLKSGNTSTSQHPQLFEFKDKRNDSINA